MTLTHCQDSNENGDSDGNQQTRPKKRMKHWKRGEFQRNSARQLQSQNESNCLGGGGGGGDIGNCRWFMGSSIIERASSRHPTFNGVKAALYTSSIPINKHQQAVQSMLAFMVGLSGNRLQGPQKLPSTAYYSKQVEAALFRQYTNEYTNHNKQINSARARWLSWLPSQNLGTSMGETS